MNREPYWPGPNEWNCRNFAEFASVFYDAMRSFVRQELSGRFDQRRATSIVHSFIIKKHQVFWRWLKRDVDPIPGVVTCLRNYICDHMKAHKREKTFTDDRLEEFMGSSEFSKLACEAAGVFQYACHRGLCLYGEECNRLNKTLELDVMTKKLRGEANDDIAKGMDGLTPRGVTSLFRRELPVLRAMILAQLPEELRHRLGPGGTEDT